MCELEDKYNETFNQSALDFKNLIDKWAHEGRAINHCLEAVLAESLTLLSLKAPSIFEYNETLCTAFLLAQGSYKKILEKEDEC